MNQSVVEFAKIALVQEGESEDFQVRVKILASAIAVLPDSQRTLLTGALFRVDAPNVLEVILGDNPKNLRLALKSVDSIKQREIALQLAKSIANLNVDAIIEVLINDTSFSKQMLQDEVFAQLLKFVMQRPYKATQVLVDNASGLRVVLKSVDSVEQREIAIQLSRAAANLSVEAMIEVLASGVSHSKQVLQDEAFAKLLNWVMQSPLKAAKLLGAESTAAIFEKKVDHHYVPNYFGPAYKKLSPLPSKPMFGSLASEVIATETCLLNYDRLFTLFNVLKRLSETHQTNFGVIEVGVYQGGTSLFLARVLESLGFKECSLHSCDTFEGHNAVDLIAGVDRYTSAHFVDTSEQAVRTLLSDYSFAQVHVGRIQDTYQSLPDKVGLIHLDTDLYEPTRFVLDMFYDRLIQNGAIVIDDYDTKSCPGVKSAVEEFASTHSDAFILPMLTAQCVITKSGGGV